MVGCVAVSEASSRIVNRRDRKLEKSMALTKDQKHALDLVLLGHTTFIGGQAGVGKSFLVEKIYHQLADRCKRVSLTCTTGIACCNFSKALQAMTIHKWSGIGDGRHDERTLRSLLRFDEKYSDAYKRIMTTDVLMIDEISMLSLSQYNKLENLCRLRNEDQQFGGLQVVLVGDFYQLPPVPNARYGDLGEFCFLSDFFPSHRVYLGEVLRQNSRQLIDLIREFALGHSCLKTSEYISRLKRPLKDEKGAVRIFSNNMLVDMHNRDCVLNLPGQLYVFEAIDTGSKRDLESLVVQQTLWLKVGAPVMLLRNFSDRLVNGLRGTVVGIEDEKVSVNFPSICQMTELARFSFTVYDPTKNKNIAERLQIPLKLAYALTVHKAQGMTLDKVIVDCRHMFAPGQLAVAIGRVQTEDGLRVVNFAESSVIKQPQVLEAFSKTQSAPLLEDMTCCIKFIKSDEEMQEDLKHEISIVDAEDSDVDFEELMCTEEYTDMVTLLNEREDDNNMQTTEENILPAQYKITEELQKLRFKEPDNPFQQNVNKLIDYLFMNADRVKQFCLCIWHELIALYDTTIKEQGKGVPQSCFHSFYMSLQKYMTNVAYKQRCALLFCLVLDVLANTVEEQYHICFNIVSSLRVLLLKLKAEKLPFCTDQMSKRSLSSNLTDTARGKVRYIGGYVIAKIRYAHCKSIKYNCNKTSALAVSKYEHSKYALEILDANFTVSEYDIVESSKDKGSLQEVLRKQNINRGLTHISDEAYLFFSGLTEEVLKLLSVCSIAKYSSDLYKHVYDQLFSSTKLYKMFCGICHTECIPSNATDVKDILSILTYRVEVLGILYSDILQRILAVFLKQFIKDTHMTLHIGKKMEHRKQIQVNKADCKKQKKRQRTSYDEKNKDTEKRIVTEEVGILQPILPGHFVFSNESDFASNADDLCGKCKEWYKSDEEWIHCDFCSKWFHRHCVGIKTLAAWKKNSKSKARYACPECK